MDRIEIGKLIIYPRLRRAEVEGVKIKLSSKQWELVEALSLRPGMIARREFLLEYLYPDPEDRPCERTIDMLAFYVRKKLASMLNGANYVQAISSEGYALRAPA